MKYSDIDDKVVLNFLAKHQGKWATWDHSYFAVPTVSSVMPGVPPKLQLSKMKQLIKRKFVSGCDCGCRGDFEITDKGLEFIGLVRTHHSIG